jgi:hypothetical protein
MTALGSKAEKLKPKRSCGLPRDFAGRVLRNIGRRTGYSGLMLAARITLAHFSVSLTRKFANSAGGRLGQPPQDRLSAL